MVVTFVLGAGDPEMEEITKLLDGYEVWFAAVGDERCHPGNAYVANSIVSIDLSQNRKLNPPYDNFIFVECRPADVSLDQKHVALTVIDHHELGDPGYAFGPVDFWQASSLGQTVGLLHQWGRQIAITQEMRVLAAMDHCRQAAIRGECPGVSAEEIVGLRVATFVARHGMPADAVRSKIDEFVGIFQKHDTIVFGSGETIDFTDHHLGVGYSLDFLCAQTALDMLGFAALLRNNESPHPEDEKILLTGHVTPEMVEHFLSVYGPARNLHRFFGVPERGYAGGYFLHPPG
jgi:hypothetical protein